MSVPGTPDGDGSRPSVTILSCGGTISSTKVDGIVTPRLGAEELLARVPELASVGHITAQTVMTKASPDVTIDDALDLFDRLVDAAATGATGLVVTHGTDTLEEVAFVLDLLWSLPIPVVVTGAMRQSDAPGAEGAANLLAAVRTASSPVARDAGVLVVLNDQIHSARLVRKSHTSNVATFVSPGFGPLGYLAEGVPRMPLRIERDFIMERPSDPVASVPTLSMSIGDDATAIDALSTTGIEGLVLAGFGGGHLPGDVARSAGLADLLARVPVVLASRAGSGEPLTSTYSGFDGSETSLLGRGLISSRRLDAVRAKVLLSLQLSAGKTPAEIDDAFGAVGT